MKMMRTIVAALLAALFLVALAGCDFDKGHARKYTDTEFTPYDSGSDGDTDADSDTDTNTDTSD